MVKPESTKKKEKALAAIAAERAKAKVEARKAFRQKRDRIIKKARKYDKEYKDAERNLIDMRRQAKAEGNYYFEPEPKVAFAIRIRGINRMSPKVKKILQLLRLRQIHNGVFIKLNKATLQMLKLVEPYIAYGYPNLKTVRELIYKRGFGKVNGQRMPITDNSIIEQKLGQFGIECTEDLVHEIFTCGPNFREANNFLWPFKLSSPNGGYRMAKRRHFNEGGTYGNCENFINNFVRKMN